jgi:glycosyltransferase involved in cell wall biosynthesis
MPRILRVLNRLIIGGPALNATYLTAHLAPEYETLLVIGGKDDHEQDADHLTSALGIEPVVIPEMKRAIHPVADRVAYRKMKALIREFRPDIVHTHAAKSGAIGRLAAIACNVPVVVHTFHGHVFHSYFNKWKTNAFIQIERYLARRSSGIIAISDLQKDELANRYRICPEDKINVIPLGLDLDKFSQNQEEKRKSFRERYQLADEEIAVGIIGRIVPVKNHSLFVKVAARVLAGTEKKVRFLVIGDGEARSQMEAELRAAGVDYSYYPDTPARATVVCTSWQTQMDEVLAGLDMVMLTSHNEGTPVSLIEAQAAGRPVVSTRVGGVADVVLADRSGMITEPGNVEEMTAALLRLIGQPELRTDFGRTGNAYVMERYSYRRLVRDMNAYYERLLLAARYPNKVPR